ncbi:MAG TPA: sigma factor-like helix-turn-helix DNA-binding protein [Chryseolinea sp.]|nr:sigma factor-like helix-turn-helix DNA-binding protein [Chryseolinea sp.]
MSAYLYAAVKYKVINHLEKELSRRHYTAVQLNTAIQIKNTTGETILNELSLALEREIQKLPPKRQQIFKMSREDYLSIKQVASTLGISEKTAENHYALNIFVSFLLND